jgi:hypothetical protein
MKPYTIRRVWHYGRQEDYPAFRKGDRVQVCYERRIDRTGNGSYIAVPANAVKVTWWPIYDNHGVETVGVGTITRVCRDRDAWGPHYWVRMDATPPLGPVPSKSKEGERI